MPRAALGLSAVLLVSALAALSTGMRTIAKKKDGRPTVSDSPALAVTPGEVPSAAPPRAMSPPCRSCNSVPKFVPKAGKPETANAAVSVWPPAPTAAVVARVELARRHHRDEFIKAAGLSPAEQEQLDAIVTEVNRAIEELIDKTVTGKVRDAERLTDEERNAFLVGLGTALQNADEALSRLSPAASAAMESKTSLSVTQLDPENSLRVATIHQRYLAGAQGGG